MKGMKIRRVLWTCILLLAVWTLPALAETLPETELAILLNGQPVEEVVLNLSEGKTLQFSATEPVTWKSSKTYRGTIDANGLFTSLTSGTLNISATAQDGRKVVCAVEMTRLVTDITITGASEVTAGERVTLKATAAPSNAVNRKVKWSTSDKSIATVDSSGRVTAKSVSETKTVIITATAADGSGVTAQHTLAVKPLSKSVSILKDGNEVKEIYLDISNNPTAQLTAKVLPEDAAQDVKWKSSSSRVSVNQNGLITGKKTGTATITVTTKDDGERKATVKVHVIRMVQNIAITGSDSVLGGKSITLKAVVSPSDASERDVVWTSSDTSILTVDKNGQVTAIAGEGVRSAVITAAATDGSGIVAQHTVTVTPAIESMEILLNGQPVKEAVLDLANPTLDLDVRILPEEAGQAVKWTSDSSSRVKFDQNGVVTGLKSGTVTLTATAQDGSNKKASVRLKLTRAVQSIEVTGDIALAGGAKGELNAKVIPSNATNDDVKWESSNPDLLTVSKYGDLKAAKVESVQQVIVYAKAQDGSGVVGSATVTITPGVENVTILLNGQEAKEAVVDLTTQPQIQLTHLIQPADALQEVKWTSSNTKRATVDQNGVVTAHRTGSVNITATAKDGSGEKAVIALKVIRAVESITVTGDTALLGGKEGKVRAKVLPSNATDDEIKWESSNPEILSVNKYGSLKAAKVDSIQQVTIYAKAKDGSGVVGSITVTITPRASKVIIMKDGQPTDNVGIDLAGIKTLNLAAMIEPADAAQNVKWTSSSSRLKVTQDGTLTGLRAGTVTVTATAQDGSGVKAKVTVNVGYMVKQIQIVGASQITGGRKLELTTKVAPSNATKKSVTWSSSDTTVARVDSDGEVTAAKVDVPTQVTIYATAKDGSGIVAEHVLTVTPAASRIQITRTDGALGGALFLDKKGGTAQLSAEVYPANANQKVTWSTSDDDVVTVTVDGLVTVRGGGRTTIVAKAADGSGVKAVLWVGVGDLNNVPYYFEVDRANQVVRVYERGADNSYTTLIKRMICSTGKNSTPGLDNGLYSMHGGRMIWMDGVAIYATRIKGHYLFHSVIYEKKSMSALDVSAYKKLGTKASGGCIRLLAGDAKWIHDNVPKGCFVMMMEGVRDVREYGAVTLPALKSGRWDPTNPHPNNPDFDPTYTSDVQ